MRQTARSRPVRTAVLTATIAVLAAMPGVAGAAAGFGDVDDDEFYTDAVAWMVGQEITTGIEAGCFGPNENVTRGQIAAFLFRLDRSLGYSVAPTPHPFDDVTAAYQQDPVGWLYATGITTGTGPRSFDPSAPITRGDFAVMLWRYDGERTPTTSHGFGDVTKGYQQTAISWMADREITTGTTATTFDPDGLMTRAQAAAFMFRYVGPSEVPSSLTTVECTRDMRMALIDGGLTATEATCAAPYLVGFSVEYLIAVVSDQEPATIDLIVTAALIGQECISPERISELTRLFL